MYKVTVGVCCFKQKKWLYRCLRSLASQTLPSSKFEVIVVNDDPDSNIKDVCDNVSDIMNIRLINNEKNIGLPASLNKILSVARGRYFVRVDCDDYVSNHFLYYLSLFLDMNRENQAVTCDYREVNSSGGVVNYHVSSVENPIACGVMFTYESLCEIGYYDESFNMREGHDLMKRFNCKFNVFNIPVPLYRYRKHESNRTLNKDEVLKYDKKLDEDNK